MEELIAKTNPIVSFMEHSMTVANNCKFLADKYIVNKTWRSCAYTVGLFHDVGKILGEFQDYLKNEETPEILHNISSALIFWLYVKPKANCDYVQMNSIRLMYSTIMRVLLGHHPYGELSLNMDSALEKIKGEKASILPIISELIETNNRKNPEFQLDIKDGVDNDTTFSDECSYLYQDDIIKSDIKDVPYQTLFALITKADRDYIIDDAYMGKDLNLPVVLSVGDIKKPEEYDAYRFNIQNEYVEKIVNSDVRIFEINENTGFGKTDILLRSVIAIGSKVMFICPTNNLCDALYNSVTRLLELYNIKLNVGLYYKSGGGWVKGLKDNINNDIIVTNIDNFFNPFIRDNDMKEMAFESMVRTVVFDEYHTYMDGSGCNRAFQLLNLARLNYNAKTIFCSATPQPSLYKPFKANVHTEPRHYNGSEQKRYVFHSLETFNLNVENNSIVMVNGVKTSQKLYDGIKTNNGISNTVLCHSNYIVDDMNRHIVDMYHHFSKNKNEEGVMVCTNLVTTGHDISANNFYTDAYLPMYEFQQGLGRVNRWGGEEVANIYIIPSDSYNKLNLNKSEYAAVRAKYDNELCKLGRKLFMENVVFEKEYDESELVKLFDTICNDTQYKKAYDRYADGCKKQSQKVLHNMAYLYSYKGANDGVQRISQKQTLRGNSESQRFIIAEGMKQPIIANYLDENDFRDSQTRYMFDYIDKRPELYEKYHHTSARRYKKKQSWSNLFDMYWRLALSIETPFITSAYTYDSEHGLMKK